MKKPKKPKKPKHKKPGKKPAHTDPAEFDGSFQIVGNPKLEREVEKSAAELKKR